MQEKHLQNSVLGFVENALSLVCI